MFNYNIFVGSENGLFKGVNTLKGEFKNMNLSKSLTKNKEIVAMCWANAQFQDEVYYATKDHFIHSYKCTKENEVDQICDLGDLDVGEGVIRGFEMLDTKNLVTCTESGVVNTWSLNDKKSLKTFNVGNMINCMKKCSTSDNLIATGGKENDLKVWNLESDKNEAIFKAKNVADNWIQLREPIWVMCVDFYEQNKVVVGTGHHQVRLYDLKSGMRRPVISMEYEKFPITALAVHPQNTNHILVGNTRGEMEMLDTRNSKPMNKYKGFAGTVKSIVIDSETNRVATCSLDRFLRIHDISETTLLNKMYLKSRLNCCLFSKHEPVAGPIDKKSKNIADKIEDDLVSDINSEDLGTDSLWSDLETMADEHPKVFADRKRRRNENNDSNGFKKPKIKTK